MNRGGCTFILNHRALSETPNTIPRSQRSRGAALRHGLGDREPLLPPHGHQGGGFPIHHVARSPSRPSLNTAKVQAEIVGSTLYAGLTDFLRTRPQHELDFAREESDEVCRLADAHLARRWRCSHRASTASPVSERHSGVSCALASCTTCLTTSTIGSRQRASNACAPVGHPR